MKTSAFKMQTCEKQLTERLGTGGLSEDSAQDTVADAISPIEEVIADARAGKVFILVDDPDRENEGDLVVLAEHATPEAINFMARFGRGLICLALGPERAAALDLQLMPRRNVDKFHTAFTLSIDAREGITTGISAADRSRTVRLAADANTAPDDFVTPGHVFPLIAKPGGVLERVGHTEASVDIARMTGSADAAVICEIMNDDGTMARLPDLARFARTHGLKIGTISDLVCYRMQLPAQPAISRQTAKEQDSRCLQSVPL